MQRVQTVAVNFVAKINIKINWDFLKSRKEKTMQDF